jgi:hypothetical protein
MLYATGRVMTSTAIRQPANGNCTATMMLMTIWRAHQKVPRIASLIAGRWYQMHYRLSRKFLEKQGDKRRAITRAKNV